MIITLSPSGQAFTAEAGETILQAAKRNHVLLPYGCSSGACSTCKAKILHGDVDHSTSQLSALPQNERDQGWALLCTARIKSDVVVDADALPILPGQTLQRLPALVVSIDRPTEDVMILVLKLPAKPAFVYRPGQYVDLLLKDNQRRSFSIANAPRADGHLEFHIRHIPKGEFTGRLFDELKVRDVLRVEGPLGTFHLRASDKPAVLLGGGTGFAPLKAVIEQALEEKDARPLHLYWGAAEAPDLYLHQLPMSWVTQYAHITYVPMLSGAADGWSGRRGLIHTAVLADFPSLAHVQVYACGSPAMVDAARDSFVGERDLSEKEFFSDAFTFIRRPT